MHMEGTWQLTCARMHVLIPTLHLLISESNQSEKCDERISTETIHSWIWYLTSSRPYCISSFCLFQNLYSHWHPGPGFLLKYGQRKCRCAGKIQRASPNGIAENIHELNEDSKESSLSQPTLHAGVPLETDFTWHIMSQFVQHSLLSFASTHKQ